MNRIRSSADTFNRAWVQAVWDICQRGRIIAPRGRKTRELDHYNIQFDMRYPVLTIPVRKLSYRAMAAEAYWILSGSNRLDGITPWIPRMAEFSDDGVTLAGAYGPKISGQVYGVVQKLITDIDTRQATMTIWTPNPMASKDIPCTVALDFKVRDGYLDIHVFMRSSDVWLGLPYDVFTFTCVAADVLDIYRREWKGRYSGGTPSVRLGRLYLTAASSHLYEEDIAKLLPDMPKAIPAAPTPESFGTDLMILLAALRDSKKGDPIRWWEAVL